MSTDFMWILTCALNIVIGASFFMVAAAVFSGLYRSGQIWANRLGFITGGIFFSCAAGHAEHAVHMLLPFVGINVAEGLALRSASDWHLALIDSVTVVFAVLYWMNRRKLGSALNSGALFSDLQRRFEVQGRELASKGRIADALQQALTPSSLPPRDVCSFDAVYVPAEDDAQVGGDWYDVFDLPDGRIAFTIGDVTGHGLQAAAITMSAREAIIAVTLEEACPSTVLARVNRIFCTRNLPIVTAVFGIVDTQAARIRYATAGHPAPLLIPPSGDPVFLQHDGLPLGVEMHSAYPTFTAELTPGSIFVCYTDGVTEYNRDLFNGEARLLQAARTAVARHVSSPSRFILKSVLGTASLRDDAALLCVKYVGEPVVSSYEGGQRWQFNVADPERAARLRVRVMDYLRAHSRFVCDPDVTELIIGELLSNVARHTPGPIIVDVGLTNGRWSLRVEDCGEGFVPHASLPEDPLCENGRGMFLIHELAENVEVAPGKHRGSIIQVTLPTLENFGGAAGELPPGSKKPSQRVLQAQL